MGADLVRRLRRRISRRPSDRSVREWAFEVGDRKSSLTFYRVVRFLCRSFLHPFLRLEVRGAEHLDRSGPLVLAPVHRSHLDTVVVATVCRRRLRALGKESLFLTPVVRWVCAALGAIPVRRGAADTEALKAALALLQRGEAMFVFPEGGRFTGSTEAENNTVQPLFDGAAWLAARTKAPVVPIGIAGTAAALGSGAKRLHRSTVRIVVGEPMPPPSAADGGRAKRDDLAAYTATLATTLQALQDEAAVWAAEDR